MKRLTALTFGIFLALAVGAQVTTNPTVTGVGTNLATMVTGVLSPANGGTGVANNAAATLTRSGNHALTVTTVGTTGVTFPTTGTLATVAGTLPITGGTLTGNLLFTDNTYDIGASGATRPKDIFASGSVVAGGAAHLFGAGAVGTTIVTVIPQIQNHGTTAATAAIAHLGWMGTSASAAPQLLLGRSRGTAVGSFVAVAANDILGRIEFAGVESDNTTLVAAAEVRGNTEAVASGIVSGYLTLHTRTIGGALTEAMRIDGSQGVKMVAAVTMPGLATGSGATEGTLCRTVTTGNITVNTTLACLSSSGRYKQNIHDLDMGLKQVMALRPVAYELKPEFNPTGLGEMPGLVAEEVAEVDKRLVGMNADGKTVEGVRYMQMAALLVKAIQEQQAQIKKLTTRLVAVESGRYAANDKLYCAEPLLQAASR